MGIPHHHCEVIETHAHPPMGVQFFLVPFLFFGSVVLFSVILVALLLVAARTRLTPVVVARDELQVENAVGRAIDFFTHLNNR